MNATEFIKVTAPDDNIDIIRKTAYTRPRALCADQFSVSIQANNYAYCTPRRWDADSYSDVELGFPSQEDAAITPYAEDDEDLLNTEYPFTPMDVVEHLIEKHGGIVGYVDIMTNQVVLFTDTCGPNGCGH